MTPQELELKRLEEKLKKLHEEANSLGYTFEPEARFEMKFNPIYNGWEIPPTVTGERLAIYYHQHPEIFKHVENETSAIVFGPES